MHRLHGSDGRMVQSAERRRVLWLLLIPAEIGMAGSDRYGRRQVLLLVTGLVYNASLGVRGGLSPLVATWRNRRAQSDDKETSC